MEAGRVPLASEGLVGRPEAPVPPPIPRLVVRFDEAERVVTTLEGVVGRAPA